MKPRGLVPRQSLSWPPTCFDSMSLPSSNSIVLGWEDPWLHDCPQSHVVFSHDGGSTWRYTLLGHVNPYLAHDFQGRLLCLNVGYVMRSDDGGTWTQEGFDVEWPPNYGDKKVCLLRHVQFLGPGHGYGLVVHWSKSMTATGVGVLVTTDNGKTWKHIATLPGPNYGDVNSRHALSLSLG
jgi:hypothetical protein